MESESHIYLSGAIVLPEGRPAGVGQVGTNAGELGASLNAVGPAHEEGRREGRAPKLKGSIGEWSNHSNFSHQSSVKILSKFNAFC